MIIAESPNAMLNDNCLPEPCPGGVLKERSFSRG